MTCFEEQWLTHNEEEKTVRGREREEKGGGRGALARVIVRDSLLSFPTIFCGAVLVVHSRGGATPPVMKSLRSGEIAVGMAVRKSFAK